MEKSAVQFLLDNRDRRDERSNVELAAGISSQGDAAAVAELVEAFGDRRIDSDIIKVLYEIAERKPDLIAPQIDFLLGLLSHRSNRVVWGAMTAIDAVAGLVSERVFAEIEMLRHIANSGSVITRDHFVGTLIRLAERGLPVGAYLEEQLANCPSNQLPMYAERASGVIAEMGPWEFVRIFEARIGEMKTDSKKRRLASVVKKLGRADQGV